MSGSLALMIGPSGSGKSTYVRENLSEKRVISADKIRRRVTGTEADQSMNRRVFAIQRRVIENALRAGQHIVIDNTNVQSRSRLELYCTARGFIAPVHLYVMQTPLEQCLRNNLLRPNRTVPEAVVRRQYNEFIATLGVLSDEMKRYECIESMKLC